MYFCSSNKIKKSIMAPMISGSKLKDEGDELFDKDSFKQRKIFTKVKGTC